MCVRVQPLKLRCCHRCKSVLKTPFISDTYSIQNTMVHTTGQLVSWLGTLFLICGEVRGLGDAVVYAVNCGGEVHTDILGVKYERDDNKYGTGSDYGKQLMIGRVSQQDQILYQTERYHTSTFGYDMPVQGDGDYLLILKFSEVGE